MKLPKFVAILTALCTSIAASSTTYCLFAFFEEADIPESLLKKQMS